MDIDVNVDSDIDVNVDSGQRGVKGRGDTKDAESSL